MKNMNNKIIILATSLSLLASFIFLSVMEKKQADLNTKNVWMAYFDNPKDNTLNFTIENHSDKNSFHWEILKDKNKIQEGNASIANGSSNDIKLSLNDLQNNKITIRVTNNDNFKDIYKIIN